MSYSIGEAAKMVGLTAHTLRFYDKEGLLPFVKKTSSGLRAFTESDIEWLKIIECLKGTGLPLKQIKQYIDWCMEGDSTIPQRLNMFIEQKKHVEEQKAKWEKHLEKINFKIKYYEDAAKHGDLNVFERNPKLLEEKKRLFKD